MNYSWRNSCVGGKASLFAQCRATLAERFGTHDTDVCLFRENWVMRDYILLYINGKRFEISGSDAFLSLSDFLRLKQRLVGTKIVCSEGDCGACTVMLGKRSSDGLVYKTINSCIAYLYQLDCCHIVTVEGLTPHEGLSAIQESMVKCHGSQCGFCTPGFVVSITDVLMRKPDATETEIKDSLTGNLCRCTGYAPILDAVKNTNLSLVNTVSEYYPAAQIVDDFDKHAESPVFLTDLDERTLSIPTSVESAISFKAARPETRAISGGTDLGVQMNKGWIAPKSVLSLSRIPDLSQISIEDETLTVGALVTWAELEEFSKTALPEFAAMLNVFGSLQIRNSGTIAGNIANASPIADSLPFLCVLEAKIELAGPEGRRWVNINEFYLGYKVTEMRPDELIVRVQIPLPTANQVLKLYKVSKRKGMDISTFAAGILMSRDGDTIDSVKIAYGGVGPTVLRLPQTEEFLTGKSFSEVTLKHAGSIAQSEITPISDVRGTSDYRLILAATILEKFYHEVAF